MVTWPISFLVKSIKRFTPAFTVIELVVSLGIMVTLLTVIIMDYPQSNIRLSLAITTHETSLAIREAQLKGSAVESRDLTIGGYGVYFSLDSPLTYVSFADIATDAGPNGLAIGDGLYSTLMGADETVATTTYPRGFSVSKLCAGKGYPFDATNNGSCNTDMTSGFPAITSLTINFTRPKPRPIISINQNDIAFNSATMSNLPGGCVEIINPRTIGVGNIRSVQIYLSGRIMTSDKGCQ